MKNIRFIAAMLLLAATVSLHSCKDDEENPDNECVGGTNFSFLEVGNEWEYTYFGSLFTWDTILIGRVLEEPEPGVFKLSTHTLPDQDLNGIYYVQECGDFLLRSSQLPITAADKYFKTNRVVGDAWTYTDRHTNVASEYEVIEKNVTVVVPAGTFTCDKITYHQVGTFNTDTIYFNNEFFFVAYSGLTDYDLISKNF